MSDRESPSSRPQRGSSRNPRENGRFKPLHALADLVVVHPWRVVIAGLAFLAVAGILGSPVAGLLQGGGFQDPRAESVLAADRLRATTGINAEYGVIALVRLHADSTSPAATAELAAVTTTLRRDPIVARVDGFASTHNPAFISKDGRSAYLVASVRADSLAQAEKGAQRIKSSLASDHNVSIGGAGLANIEVEKQVTADLARAETLAFPILFLAEKSGS